MIRSGLIALAIAAAFSQATPTGQSGLDRTIEEYLRLRLPPGSCAIAGMAGRIAQAVGMPVGVEYPPLACAGEMSPASNNSEELELYGLTAREALDRLVALDPRFRWIESDGVVVMRLNQAWDDPRHFLHRSIPEFNLSAKGIGNASRAVQTVLSGAERPPAVEIFRTPQGNHEFSVHLGATSLLEALNAIARDHGSLRWQILYCSTEPRPEYATVSFYTYDGSGIGSRSMFLRDATGRTYDPCAVRK